MARQPKPKTPPRPAADYGHDPANSDAQHEQQEQASQQEERGQPAATRSSSKRQRKARASSGQHQPSSEGADTSEEERPTERVSLLLTPTDAKALKMARVEDGIDANKRIRAMISKWRTDERHRGQVDRRAKQYGR